MEINLNEIKGILAELLTVGFFIALTIGASALLMK